MSDDLPPLTNTSSQQLKTKVLDEVRALDPKLLERADTRRLIELGAEAISEVTVVHGSPGCPLWHRGTVELRPMTYHNGGDDGHTSVGERGIGVPRGTLMITAAVNHEAGREIFSPRARAITFYSASEHDRTQNCGRTLLEEGQRGEEYGDERLSAEAARDRLLEIDDDAAEQAYAEIMATAFNPVKGRQEISYEVLDADPGNTAIQQSILGCEVVMAADLLSTTHIRGVLGSIEYIIEILASNVSNRILQKALEERGMAISGTIDVGRILDVIGEDTELRAAFTDSVEEQPKFFMGFRFSDREIRKMTGGKGIDDLFPGRTDNAACLAEFAQALHTGAMTPRQVWQQARVRAGYEDYTLERRWRKAGL